MAVNSGLAVFKNVTKSKIIYDLLFNNQGVLKSKRRLALSQKQAGAAKPDVNIKSTQNRFKNRLKHRCK